MMLTKVDKPMIVGLLLCTLPISNHLLFIMFGILMLIWLFDDER